MSLLRYKPRLAMAAACALLAVTLLAPAAAQRGRPAPVPDDSAGFEAIFDGKTLNNWDGEPGFWRVENGAIVGETTPERALKSNTFLIWRGGAARDFEMKADFRLTEAGNSGVQYRSALVPEVGKWSMRGPQADMDGQDRYTGLLYEERGRTFMAERGRVMRMADGAVRKTVGSSGAEEELKAALKPQDWNSLHLIVTGNASIYLINGRLMSVFIDDDSQNRPSEGLLGLQLHTGKPMKVEFRDVLLKKLN
jgi:hypothetical protein